MYVLILIFLALCVIFYILRRFRKRKIIRKLCSMSFAEKCCLLNELTEPFGFSYLPDSDIFTSTADAWQREFGYCAAFDAAAPHCGIVFDCEPVYFDYEGHTWLIEFWKGQYGVNAGGEIGVYRADRILAPDEYKSTLFQCVSDEELLPLRMELSHRGRRMFSIERFHWWLTGFHMGEYCEPEELEMRGTLRFPNEEMMRRFREGLAETGLAELPGCGCGLTLTVLFTGVHAAPSERGRCSGVGEPTVCRTPEPNHAQPEYQASPRRNAARKLRPNGRLLPCKVHFLRRATQLRSHLFVRLSRRAAQLRNRLLVLLFRRITSPFSCTAERMLYLYYFLPSAFRRTLNMRRRIFRRHP